MKKRLNILYIGRYSYPNGSAGAKRVKYQAEFLRGLNANIEVLILKEGISGVKNNIKFSYLTKTSALLKIIKFKQKYNSNIIILETLITFDTLLYVLLAKIVGYKIILDKVENFKYVKNEFSFKRKVNINVGLFLDKFLKFYSDGLLVISTLLYKQYQSLGIPILLMPNSYPKNIIVKNDKQNFNTPVKFIYAGTFGKKDGVEFLIKAFKKINKENTNIELHLIGKGSIENNNRIANEIDNNNNIFLHGFVEEEIFQEILLSGDVLTVTRINSKYANYGFPFKLTEYLCTGNPIIATKVGDIRLYLQDKKNVIIAEPENVISIVNAMLFCLKNEKETISIGKKGQKAINQFFSIEKNGKLLYEFLLSVDK